MRYVFNRKKSTSYTQNTPDSLQTSAKMSLMIKMSLFGLAEMLRRRGLDKVFWDVFTLHCARPRDLSLDAANLICTQTMSLAHRTRSSSLTQSAISASCAEGEMTLSGLSPRQGVRPQLGGPPRSHRTDPGAMGIAGIHSLHQTDRHLFLAVVMSTTSLCQRASGVAQFGSATASISTSADSDGRRRTNYTELYHWRSSTELGRRNGHGRTQNFSLNFSLNFSFIFIFRQPDARSKATDSKRRTPTNPLAFLDIT